MKTVILDLSGLKCPMPVLRTQKAVRDMQPGDLLEVIATDPMSAIDIPNLLRETGDGCWSRSVTVGGSYSGSKNPGAIDFINDVDILTLM